jgi:sugar phosphate isomerase/epimerase
MRLGLDALTTAPSSFAEDLAGYAAAGFEAIGLMESKLPADPAQGRAALAEAGLTAALCQPEVVSILSFPFKVGTAIDLTGPADQRERVDAIVRGIRRLAPYGPAAIGMATGAPGDLDPGTARRVVVEGLREAAYAAGEEGVTLALEPLAPDNPYTLVHSLTEAVELADEVGVPGLMLVADSHHLAGSPDVAEEIARHGDRVAAVQVSDRPLPGSGGSAYQLPGTAGPATVDMLAAFLARGWQGPVDVELVAPRLWKLPVADAARQCFEAGTAAIERARAVAHAR